MGSASPIVFFGPVFELQRIQCLPEESLADKFQYFKRERKTINTNVQIKEICVQSQNDHVMNFSVIESILRKALICSKNAPSIWIQKEALTNKYKSLSTENNIFKST